MLALYQAELAGVLRLQCGDIGELANGGWLVEPDTVAWHQACHLLEFYQLLYDRQQGDGGCHAALVVSEAYWVQTFATDAHAGC